MAKLNLKEISIAYAGATVASISTGAVGSYVWSRLGGVDVDYGLVVSAAWLLTVGGPSTLVAAETLRRKLGEHRPIKVSAAGGHRRGRAIPVTTNGRSSHIFMSAMPFLKLQPNIEQSGPVDLPGTFSVTIDDNNYSVTVNEIEDFLRVGWKRQRTGAAPFPRSYWTRIHRPRLKPLEYYTRLNVLLSVDGLILDRSKRRSGRLAVPPMATIKALQGIFTI